MSNQYTMKLVVDDSAVKALEKRLAALMGIKTGGTTGTAQSGGAGGIFANLGKLAAIATGIGALVILVKKIVGIIFDSSPALQAIWKLFDTSIMLIFRPIGDFIAMFLRPILSVFLRHSLKWYRIAEPFALWLGTQAGGVAARNLQSNLSFTPLPNDPLFGNDGIFTSGAKQAQIKNGVAALMGLVGKNAMESINAFVKFLGSLSVGEKLTESLKSFKIFVARLNIPEVLSNALDRFSKFIQKLNISTAIEEIFNRFRKFIAGLTIPKIITEAVSSFMGFLKGIGVPKEIVNTVKTFMDWMGSISIPDIVKTAIKSFLDFIKKIAEWISSLPDWIKGFFNTSSRNNQSGGKSSMSPTFNVEININGAVQQMGNIGKQVQDGLVSGFEQLTRAAKGVFN